MALRFLHSVPSSVVLLVYLLLMPSLLGGAISSFCLFHQQQILHLPLTHLFLLNLSAALGLALGLMPTTFYSCLAGYFFGWKCIPYLVLSYTLASLLGYTLARQLDGGRLAGVLGAKYPVELVLKKLQTSGVWLAIWCRLSPTLPFAVLNALFAMSKYPIAPFLVGGALGMIPRTTFAVYIGSQFQSIDSIDDFRSDYSSWFGLGMVMISFFGIGWIVKRKLF